MAKKSIVNGIETLELKPPGVSALTIRTRDKNIKTIEVFGGKKIRKRSTRDVLRQAKKGRKGKDFGKVIFN